MAVRNKPFTQNEIYYITFTVLGWKHVFCSEEYCDLVYKFFDYTKTKYGNEIYGYVIMPNHVHFLMKITDKSPKLKTLIMNAKRFMAYGIISQLEKEGDKNLLNFFTSAARIEDNAKHKVFEDRYDALLIYSLKFFLQKLNYIHFNPCQEKWRLAEQPEDYKHSSASNYINGHGFYDVAVMDIT